MAGTYDGGISTRRSCPSPDLILGAFGVRAGWIELWMPDSRDVWLADQQRFNAFVRRNGFRGQRFKAARARSVSLQSK
jgi:hypothetical protein